MAKNAQPILPSKVIRAEYGRTVYSATLSEGVTGADIGRSDFWVHLAPQLQKLDRIEAITEDGSHFYELIVARIDEDRSTNRTLRFPVMVVMHDLPLDKKAKAAPKIDAAVKAEDDDDGVPEGFSVSYGGPKYKYRVIQDGVVDPIADGMSKKDAVAWAIEYANKVDS